MSLRQQCVPARIAVYNAPAPIDQQHGRANPIKSVGESRSLARLVIDCLADQNRAAQVRNDELQAASALTIGRPVALVTEHPNQGGAGRGLVQRRDHAVHESLRSHPLTVEARAKYVLWRDEITNCNRLAYLSEELAHRVRVHLDVLLEVQLDIVRIQTAVLVVGATALVGGVLPTEHRRLTTDKRSDPAEHRRPQRCIKGRVVNIAHKRRKVFIISHRHLPPLRRPCDQSARRARNTCDHRTLNLDWACKYSDSFETDGPEVNPAP